ncbi:MAG: FKBP-type peptidyl-prolyl cis-trans isomerase [Bacteroidaceae bacterium]|nr:FKBP-type peptidyl-prolyl cis-trans isomerase [Bacteroidaceae bacterium]
MKKILFILLLPALLLASCKDQNNTVEEYADWQNKNEIAFKAKYSSAIASTTDNIDTIRCYSLENKKNPQPTDFVVVEKLTPESSIIKPDSKKGTPLFTDSISVSYRGRLLPSKSYSNGYVFDQSYTTEQYDSKIANPRKFVTKDLIPGFTSAIQKMHIGDHWIVYIPYQLAYGSTAQDNLPAYSMVTFDLVLEKYW